MAVQDVLEEEEDGQLSVEEQIQDLHRRFKNMENERKIFADEANSQLKRHKALIDKLNRENEKIKEDLNIALVTTTKQSGVINYSGSELKA